MDKLFVDLREKSYDIVFSESYDGLSKALGGLNSRKKLLVVTDENVEKLWLGNVLKALSEYEVGTVVLKSGEQNKNIDGILKICDACLSHKLDRSSMLLALGGGVVGDMTGFAAAIYMRGIRFVQLPTTLLSQSDSSVGGKTGVDFMGAKNILGSFHQPSLVYINIETLKTLSEREFLSGMGEVIKHGIIKDSDFFDFLYENVESIKARDNKTMLKAVKRNCEIKASVVAQDEKESSIRAILNFGHTIGHAYESASGFSKTHGECVAYGICAAAYIALLKKMIDKSIFDRITDIINIYGFSPKTDADTDEILRYMESDKKNISGRKKFVLPTEIGSVAISYDVTDEEIKKSLEYFFKIGKDEKS